MTSYKETPVISKNSNVSTCVPLDIYESMQVAHEKISPNKRDNWDEWVAESIGVKKNILWEKYCAEQIDAIGMCINRFESGYGFIIGDETGVGKGRTLCGISRWAWKNNKKVLFITERAHLFSDFWRDLIHTESIPFIKNPLLYHSKAKIYNPEMQVVLNSNPKELQKIGINGINSETNLVLTCYSQIALKQHSKNKKTILSNYLKDAIVLLDECHNATGVSNTKDFLFDLLKITPYVVFSSATFMKSESEIDLYKNHLSLPLDIQNIIKKTLVYSKNNLIRSLIIQNAIKNSEYIRREHKPVQAKWHSIVCNNTKDIECYLGHFSQLINSLFSLTQEIIKTNSSFEGEQIKNGWYILGSTINRLSRNLLLLLKIPTLVQAVSLNIKNNEKAVIVIDSTMESMLSKIHLSNKKQNRQDDSDVLNEEAAVELYENNNTLKKALAANLQEALIFIINELILNYIQTHSDQHKICHMYDELIKQTHVFSKLSLSPIDEIKQALANNSIVCGEISGRKYFLDQNGEINTYSQAPRQHIVKSFNEGYIDAIIITRSGASGISLHSDLNFKDTRTRGLYELEISNRPTYRLQFIGRVHRKNQVIEPKFYSIVTKLPFEHRILNIEQEKMSKLQSHIGKKTDKFGQESLVNLFTPAINSLSKLYLDKNKNLAYQMGISLKADLNPDIEDFYYIDSLLKRCIVLEPEKQNEIYDFLIYGAQIKNTLNPLAPAQIFFDKITTFDHKINKENKILFCKEYPDIKKTPFVFNYMWVGFAQYTQKYIMKEQQKDFAVKEFNIYAENLAGNSIHKIKPFLIKNYPGFLNLISKINIGKRIKIKSFHYNIYGYIYDIIIPTINKIEHYPHLISIHIKTINPKNIKSTTYLKSDCFLSLQDLFDSVSVEVLEAEAQFERYSFINEEISRQQYCLIGQPMYLQYLQKAYNFGVLSGTQMNNEKNLSEQISILMLPDWLDIKKFITSPRPIWEPNEIMSKFISKKITQLRTIWNDEEKSSFLLQQEENFYCFHIAQEIVNSNTLFDYGFMKKINPNFFKYTKEGYNLYNIPKKELRYLLYMLEKRGVIWFAY